MVVEPYGRIGAKDSAIDRDQSIIEIVAVDIEGEFLDRLEDHDHDRHNVKRVGSMYEFVIESRICPIDDENHREHPRYIDSDSARVDDLMKEDGCNAKKSEGRANDELNRGEFA